MLKFWIVSILPFMSRWLDAAPATCCGICGPCLTATASGLTIEAVSGLRRGKQNEQPSS